MKKALIFLVVLVFILKSVFSATEDTNSGKPDYLVYPYCFRFTWLGPKYDGNSIISNATCSTLLEDAKGIPCKVPLIATNNSNTPDTDWLWEHYKSKPKEIACRLSRGDVCVKYSVIYNQQVQYVTYMCTKVTIDGEGAAKVGSCYSQVENGKEVEVCVCESTVGSTPCNYASGSYFDLKIIVVLNILIISKWIFVDNNLKYRRNWSKG